MNDFATGYLIVLPRDAAKAFFGRRDDDARLAFLGELLADEDIDRVLIGAAADLRQGVENVARLGLNDPNQLRRLARVNALGLLGLGEFASQHWNPAMRCQSGSSRSIRKKDRSVSACAASLRTRSPVG